MRAGSIYENQIERFQGVKKQGIDSRYPHPRTPNSNNMDRAYGPIKSTMGRYRSSISGEELKSKCLLVRNSLSLPISSKPIQGFVPNGRLPISNLLRCP